MTLNELLLDEDNDYLETVKIIKQGDWENDYKDYCFREDIVKFDNKFYRVVHNRSGNYYSDYEYGDIDIEEVKPVQVTVTQYKSI